jgi:hypothetical protein
MTKRIEKLVVQIVVSEYDEKNNLLNEQTSQQVVMYRKRQPNVWVEADKMLANTEQASK